MTDASPRITVAHIIDDLGIGGTQRQLVELVKHLPRDRYDVRVISLSTTKTHYHRTIKGMGVTLHEIPQSGAWDWRCLFALLRLLRSMRPTIVHTWLFTADLYGRIAAWLIHSPIVISSVRSVEPWKPRHHVMADRLLRHVTDGFIVNAKAIGDVLMSRERVNASAIHTIYNGLNLRLFDPAHTDGAVRRRFAPKETALLVGILGRLGPEKDHATFLRAAGFVHERLPAARFLIVGNGALERELRALTATLRLDGVVSFLESQPNIAEVFAALDLVVVSSRYEGCCNVILEGMAMGKPVIATAVGGNPELVADGTSGLLVPPQDPERLAEAIMALESDTARRRTMGRAARERAESHFTVDRMVQETIRLYQHLLNTRSRRN